MFFAKFKSFLPRDIADEFSSSAVFKQALTVAKNGKKAGYERVVVNDFLHSNNVMYRAFFAPIEWTKGKVQAIIDEFNTCRL